jgi:thiamine monophosphate kinase
MILDAGVLVAGSLEPLGEKALELVLHGGEDYALVVTSAEPITGFRQIGVCEEGEGVWLERGRSRERVAAAGWDHFRARNGARSEATSEPR